MDSIRTRMGCLVCWVGSLFCSLVFAQETNIQPKSINVFQLPSVQQTVVVDGGGYFPVLNCYDLQLCAILRTGGGHLGIGGALSRCRADLLGEIWSAPQVAIDGPADDRNPAVGVESGGRLILAYHEQASYRPDGQYDPDLNRARCLFCVSSDGGVSWSSPQPLGVEGLETCSPYGRILAISNGDWLMNVYGPYSERIDMPENRRALEGDYAYLVRSADGGRSWGEPSLIMAQHNETSLLELPGGRLVAVGRSSSAMQRLDYSFSHDRGRTWSSPLRLTGFMQHPADLVLLNNGWIVCFYGDRSSEEKVIRGIISRDRGRTWDYSYGIIASRPVRGDFGYPSAVLNPNGNIALMYYWAGVARDAYDGSKANAFLVQFDESELIEAYQKLLASE